MFAEWIFEHTVIPDARSRHALEVACARGMFRAPHPMREYPQLEPLEPGAKGSYFHRGVADAIREMVENQGSETGQIRCDFDLGPSWDVEEIIRERSGWTRKMWRKSGNWKTFIDHCGCREILDYEMVSLYDIPEEAYL
ncbi:uncharacterized protein F4807DRAFT_237824 [Annulohypoxylon truncatum]|uniref:uncharacterized protein n=1 Tax=Annulohypoxylon truncatum TaxID=327061 RepID=UPI00200886A7|nr:uncharacterized protein F4807DRAFT_237824 [Annulohypoxylon truncatum]KAI1206119.1 hypothetical protein F4807DRAFT_237824 [Annulohypoxylon truncatum]